MDGSAPSCNGFCTIGIGVMCIIKHNELKCGAKNRNHLQNCPMFVQLLSQQKEKVMIYLQRKNFLIHLSFGPPWFPLSHQCQLLWLHAAFLAWFILVDVHTHAHDTELVYIWEKIKHTVHYVYCETQSSSSSLCMTSKTDERKSNGVSVCVCLPTGPLPLYWSWCCKSLYLCDVT